MAAESYDVVIVGAGLSGINFAQRLQTQLPELSYCILEGRSSLGGTWDLFKYPGVRSDTDLFTFGFVWRPWQQEYAIAEGHKIVEYLQESAAEFGIDKKIKFRHVVKTANWLPKSQSWSFSVDADRTQKTINSRFMMLCSGYYDYETPLDAVIPGISDFSGQVIHPQFWPKDLDYAGKNVVIVGSGATAITLLPAISKTAGHVTMLQRSPSYIASKPQQDAVEWTLWNLPLPRPWVARMMRLKSILQLYLFVTICGLFPNKMKQLLRNEAARQLPSTISIDPHFSPVYNPFDQRVCLCPDGDFYEVLRSGRGSIATGVIDKVTKDSIIMANGQVLKPDIIVTATGLKLRLGGGIKITVDGQPWNMGEKFVWKTAMLQDLPNAGFVYGYLHASWTLGADATALLICRLLRDLRTRGVTSVVPRLSEKEQSEIKPEPLMKMTSTFVKRAAGTLPRTADLPQWQGRTHWYFRDLWNAKFGDLSTSLEYTY